MKDEARVRALQGLGLHALAEALLRQGLAEAQGRDRERLHYLLALSLDALGQPREAAVCYALAMDSALAPLLHAHPDAPRAIERPAGAGLADR